MSILKSLPARSSLPDLLKATLVIPQMILSCEYWGKGTSGVPHKREIIFYHAQLLVGSDVKEPAGGVVRPGCKRIPVREELQDGGQIKTSNGQQQMITVTALMSDSWPVKVCLQIPSRTSHS